MSVASGTDFAINVGTVNDTVLVRIWDPTLVNSLPDDDAGKVTINGTWASGGELRLLVAGPNEPWTPRPQDRIESTGLRHLGLDASDGIVITDPALRARTRLAAFTSDDIKGTIEVGQVQRIQAGFRPPGGDLNPGTISASITTIAVDNAFVGNETSIGYISAGNGITGNITATGAHDDSTGLTTSHASIGRVVVGPNESGVGLQGNIIAEDGHIGSIYTTGPIGEQNHLVAITAGDGIEEIRAIGEANATNPDTSNVLAKDFEVDIMANAEMSRVLAIDPTNYTFTSQSLDGALYLLDTKGNLHGNQITVGNIGCRDP